MKTWQAFLAQMAVGAAQAAVGTQFFQPTGIGHVFANMGIQFGSQAALGMTQYWIAKKNSETDPKGQKLVQNIVTGQYTSEK